MPLVLKKEENNITLYIWKIQESIEELKAKYPKIDSPKFSSNQRTLECFTARVLINIYSTNCKIYYDSNGAPTTNLNKNISISHCDEHVCIAISKNNIGVDIEKISEKALKLKDKFINKNQSNLTQKKATLIWTIKESVFKFHKKGNVNFKKDIVLDDFKEKNEGDLAIKFKRQKLNAYFFMIDNKYITYVCK